HRDAVAACAGSSWALAHSLRWRYHRSAMRTLLDDLVPSSRGTGGAGGSMEASWQVRHQTEVCAGSFLSRATCRRRRNELESISFIQESIECFHGCRWLHASHILRSQYAGSSFSV